MMRAREHRPYFGSAASVILLFTLGVLAGVFLAPLIPTQVTFAVFFVEYRHKYDEKPFLHLLATAKRSAASVMHINAFSFTKSSSRRGVHGCKP